MSQKISTQPYKGTSDWLPVEFSVQKYIFDTWREVCLRFGFKEYLTPLLESTEIYKAKSGAVKEELFVLYDRAKRELALRPEMTPSVTRMVAAVYKESPKPLKLFSIANFYRNEAPQRGRTREFWQLNADVFGEESINADLEILILALEIMLAFNPPEKSFKLYFNNRLLIDDFLNNVLQVTPDKKEETARILDKFEKLSTKDFETLLQKTGLDQEQCANCITFLTSSETTLKERFVELADSKGLSEIKFLKESLIALGYESYIEFKPAIIRGFDYYNGMIFEVFDMNPNNNRSMFGGGRYNGLSEIFGVENFPASGFAPGNITTELFLKDWNLLPDQTQINTYYLPVLDEKYLIQTLIVAKKLRIKGYLVEVETSAIKLNDALRKANKKGFENIVILGENEITQNKITIKNLKSGEQTTSDL